MRVMPPPEAPPSATSRTKAEAPCQFGHAAPGVAMHHPEPNRRPDRRAAHESGSPHPLAASPARGADCYHVVAGARPHRRRARDGASIRMIDRTMRLGTVL